MRRWAFPNHGWLYLDSTTTPVDKRSTSEPTPGLTGDVIPTPADQYVAGSAGGVVFDGHITCPAQAPSAPTHTGAHAVGVGDADPGRPGGGIWCLDAAEVPAAIGEMTVSIAR